MRRGGLKKEKPEDFEFLPVSGADTTYTVLKVGEDPWKTDILGQEGAEVPWTHVMSYHIISYHRSFITKMHVDS